MDRNLKQTLHNRCSVMALAAIALTSAVPGIAFAQEDTEAAESGNVITVTARKREENFMEVPLAITALGTEEIQARGIDSISSLVDNTPGINVTGVNSGRNDRSFQQISLRGFTPSTTTSTLTATFINGVPVASATALNSITDPARIEILRGPQNAYFGRNAFAGAVNIVTKEAEDYFGGTLSAQASTRNGHDISASLYGPIVEGVLGFRVSGRSTAVDGTYTNGFNRNQTLGDQSTRTGTLQLDFTPSEALTVRAFGLYSTNDDGPSADGMVSAYELRANNGAINIPLLSGSNAGTVIVPSQANCTHNSLTSGVLATEARVPRPFICGKVPQLNPAFSPSANTIEDPLLGLILADGSNRVVSPRNGTKGYGLVSEFYHLNLAIDYELGDTGITLSSLTGYNHEYYSQVDDLDNYDNSLLNGSLAGVNPAARQVWNFPFMVERVNKDFSQELRASYDNLGPIQAMFGVSYLKADTRADLVSVFAEEQFRGPRSTGSRSAPGRAETIGIFGSVNYDLTDALNISLEARWQQDEIFAIAGGRGTTIRAGNANGIPAGTYTYGDIFFSKKYDNFTPRAIISYDVNPDVMVYASFSQSANVGITSFNSNLLTGSPGEIALANGLGLQVTLEPELLDNYEVGLKGSFLDGRLRAAVAAYRAIWTDQYNARTAVGVDPGTNLPVIVSGVANTGKTQLTGVEIDLWAEPVDGLSMSFSGSYNGSSIRTFADPSISRLTGLIGDDFRGNHLPLTSQYSANGSLQYTGDIPGWENGSFFIRTDVNWKSKQFVDAANLTWIGDRAVVNGRIGFTKDDFSLDLFVTNLFDDRNYVSVAQNSILVPGFALSSRPFGYVNPALPEGRIVGIRAGVEF